MKKLFSCVLKMEGSTNHDGDMFKKTVDTYTYWKTMMEDHLYCKYLHELISQKDKPEGME